MSLAAAKIKLQMDIEKALKEAFKSTFIYSGGEEGDELASIFAKKGSGPIADAVYDFVTSASIKGQNAMLASVIAPPGMVGGPCTGALVFNGTELKLT